MIRHKKDWAMGILIMKDEVIRHLTKWLYPRECWIALQEVFEAQNSAKALFLVNKIHSINLEEGGSIIELWTQLESVGEVIYESIIVQIILGALPSSYESFV